MVWVEFDWDTDIYRARQIVSEKIAGVGDALPLSGAGRPTLGPQSSILGEMMIVGLTSDSISQEALRTLPTEPSVRACSRLRECRRWQ